MARQEYDSVELVGDSTVEQFVLAAVVAALTAGLAQVTIPFGPVPFTLQTAGVVLAGLALGPGWGGLSMVLYLLAGIAGAPVFAGFGAGLGVVTGPTGGYLVSYPLAAALVGGLVHRQVEPRSLTQVRVELQVLAVVAGIGLIYALGVPWLAATTDQSLGTAAVQGALVFVPGDLLKAAVVLTLVRGGHVAVADRR
ncbi:MAG: biotin transport system substrate-specific component [Halovenus sp.]|jgi:biotin transport system substrate-specific component